MIERLCKDCGRAFAQYNTTQTICQKCAYNRYAKPRKAIKRIGKVTAAWLDERLAWIENNPPSHEGYWECYLQIAPLCPKFIDIDQLTLDHVVARSKHQATELRPACAYCNGMKGSKKL